MSSSPPENEKVVTENKGQPAPSLSDESITNPTGINEKALLWKLDLRLLPPLTLLYLLSFLDRSNSMRPFPRFLIMLQLLISPVGNAKLDGLTKDLHITGNQYLFALTIYFIGYVSFTARTLDLYIGILSS
jgi:hypothetical protein